MVARIAQFIFGVVMLFAVLDNSARILTAPRVRADLNGDGRLDLAIVDRKEVALCIFLSAANGGLVLDGKYLIDDIPQAVAVGDFNRDGRPDLATASASTGTISVLLNSGNGTFRSPYRYELGVRAPFRLDISDFDADENFDLIVSDIRGRQSVLLGNGEGSFHQMHDPLYP